jgi:hypothetical protein
MIEGNKEALNPVSIHFDRRAEIVGPATSKSQISNPK